MDKFFGQRGQSNDRYKRVDYNYISSQNNSLSTGCDNFFKKYITSLLKEGGLSLDDMEKQSVSPHNLISQTISEHFQFPKANINVKNLYHDEIYVDVKQIKFVFSKVLENAFQYNRGNESAIVQLENADQALVVSIKDRGIGIDQSEKVKVFQPFYRGVDASKYSNGLGLGLTLSHEIIKHHEADIRIESAGFGLGTSVYISFPFKDDRLLFAKRASTADETQRTLAY